jgi:hypothetical protein
MDILPSKTALSLGILYSVTMMWRFGRGRGKVP